MRCRPLFVFAWIPIASVLGCEAPGPEILRQEMSVNPSGRAPLSALLELSTATPTTVAAVLIDGNVVHEFDEGGPYSTSHEVPILGLKPDRGQQVSVRVRDEDGRTTESAGVTVTLGPLPQFLPPMELTVSQPERMEPGYTFVPFFRWPDGGNLDRDFGLVVALDAAGEVVWLYHTDHPVDQARRASNGNLIYTRGREGYMYEIDMLGNVVRQWHTTGVPKEAPNTSIPIATDTIHHDFWEMPNGNYLILSTEVRRYEDYPLSATDPEGKRGPANVIGDVLVEVKPDSGEIVREWKLMDLQDPFRVTRDSLGTGFWASVYEELLGDDQGKDMSHTNAVYYLPDEDAVILSQYHQHVVMKLNLAESRIEWMLGNPADWQEPWADLFLKTDGEVYWPYGQHAPKITPRGTLLLYDNGSDRVLPSGEAVGPKEMFSRVVEFEINEEAGTVKELWHFGQPGGEKFFSPFICDADWLPETGNVLITDGGRVRGKDGVDLPNPFGGHHWARIIEVTHTSPPEKVFELIVDAESPDGWAVYRSERMPSLYP